MNVVTKSAAACEAIGPDGKKGLIVGVANEQSLAWAAARWFRTAGADLAITYLNDKAKPYVAPLAAAVEAPLLLPLNVAVAGEVVHVDVGYHIDGIVFH